MVIEVEEVVEEDQAFFRHPGTVTGPKVPTKWKTLADFIWLNLSSNAKKNIGIWQLWDSLWSAFTTRPPTRMQAFSLITCHLSLYTLEQIQLLHSLTRPAMGRFKKTIN